MTILVGDARQTLAALPGPVGLVLLDGWKDLCLPGAPPAGTRSSRPARWSPPTTSPTPAWPSYLDYIRDPANGYVTVAFPVEDGMEISSWTGR